MILYLRRFILGFIFLPVCWAVAQERNYEDFHTILNTFRYPYQYDEVDCEIIEATDYLLNLCYDEERYKEDYAYQSVVKWMNHTKTYHVITGGKINQNSPKRSVLYNISRITQTKYLFENDSLVQAIDTSKVKYINIYRVREIIQGGAEYFMEYLKNQDKETLKQKIPKELQKGLKLYKDGKLEEFMKYKDKE